MTWKEENIPEIDYKISAVLVDINVDENDASKSKEDLKPIVDDKSLLEIQCDDDTIDGDTSCDEYDTLYDYYWLLLYR